MDQFPDAASLDEFVRQWAEGTLPKSSWTHAAHVAVTAYYAFDREAGELFAVMKTGIIHYNLCVGTVNGPDNGYHETLTRLWSRVIAEFVRDGRFGSRLETVHQAVAVFGEDRSLHRRYYHFDVAKDRRARHEWIEPESS